MGAYEQLLAEGYIRGIGGSGTFVAPLVEEMLPSAAVHSRSADYKPRLSKRGQKLATTLPSIGEEMFGDLIPFRGSTPDATSFPFDIWARLLNRYSRNPSSDLLGMCTQPATLGCER